MSWLVSIIESTHFLLALFDWPHHLNISLACWKFWNQLIVLKFLGNHPFSGMKRSGPASEMTNQCRLKHLHPQYVHPYSWWKKSGWPVDRGVCPIIYRVLCIYIYIHIAGWCRISAINRTQNMKDIVAGSTKENISLWFIVFWIIILVTGWLVGIPKNGLSVTIINTTTTVRICSITQTTRGLTFHWTHWQGLPYSWYPSVPISNSTISIWNHNYL